MRIGPIILTFLVAFIVTGCNQSYDRGYEDGLNAAPKKVMEDAREKGYKLGYEAGFKKVYPGMPAFDEHEYASFFKLMVWGGLLKIIVTLTLVSLRVVFSGNSMQQVLGKAIFSGLGIGAAIFTITIIPEASKALDMVLMEMPKTIWMKCLIAVAAATAGFFFLDLTMKFVLKSHSPELLGWCAFLLSAILTLLIPLSYLLYNRVPDISSYSSSLVFFGMMVGALFYWAKSFVCEKYDFKSLFGAD